MSKAAFEFNVSVDLSRWQAWRRRLQSDLKNGRGDIGDAYKMWGRFYRSEMQERFDTFSKGGGDWPALKPSTIARRRKGRGGGDASILRDTGTMFNALDTEMQNRAGQYEQSINYGIVVGFGGPGAHPDGKATIADLAHFHHVGAGRLPKRELLDMPSNATVDKMADALQRAVARMVDKYSGQSDE